MSQVQRTAGVDGSFTYTLNVVPFAAPRMTIYSDPDRTVVAVSEATLAATGNPSAFTAEYPASLAAGTYYLGFLTEVTSGQPDVADNDDTLLLVDISGSVNAVVNGYCTLDELKSWLAISDTVDDDELIGSINAASRDIDAWCGRRFWQDSVDVARTFTASSLWMLDIPDLASVTSLKTDDDADRAYETTWTSDEYDTEPESGIRNEVAGWPATRLIVRTDGQRRFPLTQRGVEIAGRWGWSDIPSPVHKACCILAGRIFRRKDSPFGIAGVTETGVLHLRRNDPDVVALLEDYRRKEVVYGIG